MYNNYPAGAANDPRAPYNEPDYPEVNTEVKYMITAYKDAICCTDDYYEYGGKIYPNDAKEAYTGSNATLEEILDEFIRMKKEILVNNEASKIDKRQAKRWIYYASGWVFDEEECIPCAAPSPSSDDQYDIDRDV